MRVDLLKSLMAAPLAFGFSSAGSSFIAEGGRSSKPEMHEQTAAQPAARPAAQPAVRTCQRRWGRRSPPCSSLCSWLCSWLRTAHRGRDIADGQHPQRAAQLDAEPATRRTAIPQPWSRWSSFKPAEL